MENLISKKLMNNILIINKINRNKSYDIIIKIAKEIIGKDNIMIKKNSYGKPYIEDNSIYFSISYCNDIMVCIFSNDEIGIDIEEIRNYNKDLKDRILNKFEMCNKTEEFWKLWTLKESFVKYKGTGIIYELNKIRVHKNSKIYKQNEKAVFYITKKYKNYIIGVCAGKKIENINLIVYDKEEKNG